jgi:hypothetical protein
MSSSYLFVWCLRQVATSHQSVWPKNYECSVEKRARGRSRYRRQDSAKKTLLTRLLQTNKAPSASNIEHHVMFSISRYSLSISFGLSSGATSGFSCCCSTSSEEVASSTTAFHVLMLEARQYSDQSTSTSRLTRHRRTYNHTGGKQGFLSNEGLEMVFSV